MYIELFFDNIWFIGWLRKNWKKNCKNKPNYNNVYKIKKMDYKNLVKFILWWTAYLANKPPKIIWKTNRVDLDLWQLKLNKADYDNIKSIKTNKKNSFILSKL